MPDSADREILGSIWSSICTEDYGDMSPAEDSDAANFEKPFKTFKPVTIQQVI